MKQEIDLWTSRCQDCPHFTDGCVEGGNPGQLAIDWLMRWNVRQRRLQGLQEPGRATVGWRCRTLRVGIDVDDPPIDFPKGCTLSYHLDCGRERLVVDDAPVQERCLAWIDTGTRILPEVGAHESCSVRPAQLPLVEHAIEVAQLRGRKHTGKR